MWSRRVGRTVVDWPVVKGGHLSTLNVEHYSNRRDLAEVSVQR